MALSEPEMDLLQERCRNLPHSNAQTEEQYITDNPVLILMSTVLSLCRRWYAYALPVRHRFEKKYHGHDALVSLSAFHKHVIELSKGGEDWSNVAESLWTYNEWTKARDLAALSKYFLEWISVHCPTSPEIDGLRLWTQKVTMKEFKGKVPGVGPRGFEQLHWYIEGTQAIKLDRHIVAFVSDAIGRNVDEGTMLEALNSVALSLDLFPTELDVRIWDYMQKMAKR